MLCYDCGGTGRLNETRQVECDGCRGAGSVEQWQQYGNTNRDCWGPPGRIICSKCVGRRTVESRGSVTCPHCNGAGRRKEAAGTQSSTDWQSPPRTRSRAPPESGPSRQSDPEFTEALSQLIVWSALAWGCWWVFGWFKRLIA